MEINSVCVQSDAQVVKSARSKKKRNVQSLTVQRERKKKIYGKILKIFFIQTKIISIFYADYVHTY